MAGIVVGFRTRPAAANPTVNPSIGNLAPVSGARAYEIGARQKYLSQPAVSYVGRSSVTVV